MKSRIGAIDNINVTALIGFHIVGLNRNLAAFLPINPNAALIGRFRDAWNEESHFLRMVGVAHIDRPHTRIEETYKSKFSIKVGCHALIGRMSPEAPTALAEIAARF